MTLRIESLPGGAAWRASVEAVLEAERHPATYEGHLIARNRHDAAWPAAQLSDSPAPVADCGRYREGYYCISYFCEGYAEAGGCLDQEAPARVAHHVGRWAMAVFVYLGSFAPDYLEPARRAVKWLRAGEVPDLGRAQQR